MLKKWISILIVIICLVPLAASAYTMDDIYWSLEREDGKTVLYLKGIKGFSSDDSDNLVITTPVDKIVFAIPYPVSDIYRTLRIDKLFIPSVQEYAVEGPRTVSDGISVENHFWFHEVVVMGNIKQWPNLNNAVMFDDISVTVNGTVGFIPADSFYPSENSFQKCAYKNISLISNEYYTFEDGVLEDSFTGMPMWASEEHIFYEEPYYYMFNRAHDAVSLIDYRGKNTESEYYLPDTTKDGYPVRWISGPALIAMNPYDFTNDLNKLYDKLSSAQDQLDRWIAGGKKTEEQINKQKEKIDQLQAEYDAMYEESLKTRYRNTLYLGQNVEAVSDFDSELLDFDMLYVPVTLKHYGKGLLESTQAVRFNP